MLFLTWYTLPAKPAELGLETYDVNGAFLIRWDRDSKIIREAKRATLDIQDGGEDTPIELTPNDLAIGGYGYMRRTGDISVNLKVDGPTSAEEHSNFKGAEGLGSKPEPMAKSDSAQLAQALEENRRLKTDLVNQNIRTQNLSRENAGLRSRLAEHAVKNPDPLQ